MPRYPLAIPSYRVFSFNTKCLNPLIILPGAGEGGLPGGEKVLYSDCPGEKISSSKGLPFSQSECSPNNWGWSSTALIHKWTDRKELPTLDPGCVCWVQGDHGCLCRRPNKVLSERGTLRSVVCDLKIMTM